MTHGLAEKWYDAWNARDAERILALYADDLEFASPFVAALGFAEDGVLFSKEAFRLYVKAALPRVPDLRFDPVAECVGARGHTLIYRNQTGVLVAESHELDPDGRIVRADAAYETTAL